MLGVVLPFAAPGALAAVAPGALAAVAPGAPVAKRVDVRVPVEVVVAVYVDVAPAPAAAAAGAAPDGRAPRHADAEGDQRPAVIRRVVNGRVRIVAHAPDHRRAVRGDIDDLGVRLLHDDDRLLLDDLGLDFLLLVGRQGALVLRLLPHPLHGVHDVALLVEEGIPKLRRPLDVVREPLDDLGNRRHRLDARVPRLLRDRVGERLVFQILVLGEPLVQLDDLQRVGGRDERLGQERVRVESDGGDQRIELLRGKLRYLLLRGSRVAGGVSCARSATSPEASNAAHRTATNPRVVNPGKPA